jgi:hypothetical protein
MALSAWSHVGIKWLNLPVEESDATDGTLMKKNKQRRKTPKMAKKCC